MHRLAWFLENASCFNLDAIEKKFKIPQSTLYKWITGKRNLPKRWEKVLVEWLDDLKK